LLEQPLKSAFMRQRGTITDWNDGRGFGFIAPSSGEDKVFFHISAVDGPRRPSRNESVSFAIGTDSQGRVQARSVRLAGTRTLPRPKAIQQSVHATLVLVIFGVLAALGVADRLPIALLWIYLLASAITFCVYAMDKSAARSGRWRTSEGTLHMLALCGGWPGALLGRSKLRHKSRKTSFSMVFWLTVIINCAALAWLLTPDGAQALDSFIRQLPPELRQWL
jgi:uncharacterized membrane protein YsdA (DUF1294 family)/cold shock CspA family protein